MERCSAASGARVTRLVGGGAFMALACVIVSVSAGAPREPIVQTVDLLLTAPATTTRIAGRTHIVYELHLTSFLPVDVSLRGLDVLRADRPGEAIATYREEELRKRLGRPGLRGRVENPHVLAPGTRAVFHAWIELPAGSSLPLALSHRVELDVLKESGPVQAEVVGGPLTVADAPDLVLDPPVRGGPWAALYDPLLMGGHRTAFYTLGGRARIPARFAIDWVKVPPGGALVTDEARAPADWNGLGAEVLAVADAVVAAAMDDIPDNAGLSPPPGPSRQLENASGNYVALDLGAGRFAFYEHLKHGSVAVKAGDRVRSGEVIGRLGNSGSSSMGPHLHFHVSDASSLLAAEGLSFVFRRFDELGAFASIEAVVGGEKWTRSEVSPRERERPRPNVVVEFP